MPENVALRLLEKGHGLVKMLSPNFSLESSKQDEYDKKYWDFFCKQMINPNHRYPRRTTPIENANFAFNPLTQQPMSPNDLLDKPEADGNYKYTAMSSMTLYPKTSGLPLFNTDNEDGIGLLFEIQKSDLKRELFVFDSDARTDNDWFLDANATHLQKIFPSQPINALIDKINDPSKRAEEYNEILAGVNKDGLVAIVIQPSQTGSGEALAINYLHAIYRKNYIYRLIHRNLPIIVLPFNNDPYEFKVTEQRQVIEQFAREYPLHTLPQKLKEEFAQIDETTPAEYEQSIKATAAVEPSDASHIAEQFEIHLQNYEKLHYLYKELIAIADIEEEDNSRKQRIAAINANITSILNAITTIDENSFSPAQKEYLAVLKTRIENIDVSVERNLTKIRLKTADLNTLYSLKKASNLSLPPQRKASYALVFCKNLLEELFSQEPALIDQVQTFIANIATPEEPEVFSNKIFNLIEYLLLIKEHKSFSAEQKKQLLNKSVNFQNSTLIDSRLLLSVSVLKELKELEGFQSQLEKREGLLAKNPEGKNILNKTLHTTKEFIHAQYELFFENSVNKKTSLVAQKKLLTDMKATLKSLTAEEAKDVKLLEKNIPNLISSTKALKSSSILAKKILGSIMIIIGLCLLAAGILSLHFGIGISFTGLGIAASLKGMALAGTAGGLAAFFTFGGSMTLFKKAPSLDNHSSQSLDESTNYESLIC